MPALARSRLRILSQISCSHRLPQLLQRTHIGRQRLAIAQLRRAITALGIQKVQQRGRAVLVGELCNLERLLRLLQVAFVIQLNHLSTIVQYLVSVPDVGQDLLLGGLFQKLRLGQNEVGPGHLALVAVKNRKWNIEEERANVCSIYMRIVKDNV